MLNKKSYEEIRYEFECLLSAWDIRHERAGVDENLRAWQENKAGIIANLRKHPHWCEEAQAVILTAHESRTSFFDEIDTALCRILEWAQWHTNDDETSRRAVNMLSSGNAFPIATEEYRAIYKSFVLENTISKENADILNKAFAEIEPKLNGGQKSSRALNKILRLCCKDTDSKEYIRLFSDWADKINPLNIERPFIISANPGDYITMSYGNSWASCHIANPDMARGGETYSGCYKAGTLSYMNDETTVVCYTVEELPDDLSDLPTTPKLTRQLFMLDFDTGAFVQSRQYPDTNNTERAKEYRLLVQSVMAEIMGEPNYWTLNPGTGHFRSGTGGLQYPDYDSQYAESNHIKYCTLKSRAEERKTIHVIGSTPFCLECGWEIDKADSLLCYECKHDGMHCCDECGEWFYEEDGETVANGDWVCRSCIDNNYTYCDVCEEYVRSENIFWVSDERIRICEDCLDRSGEYAFCDECNEVHRRDSIHLIDDDELCDWCAENCCSSCVECGAVHRNIYMRRRGNGRVCMECVNSENENANTEVA